MINGKEPIFTPLDNTLEHQWETGGDEEVTSLTNNSEATFKPQKNNGNPNISETNGMSLLKINLLKNLIIPFLDNLMKNPEKPTIKWPNRKETVENIKNKLLEILEE